VEVKAGIPDVDSVGVTVSDSLAIDWTYGGSLSDSKTWSATFPISVPAGSVY